MLPVRDGATYPSADFAKKVLTVPITAENYAPRAGDTDGTRIKLQAKGDKLDRVW